MIILKTTNIMDTDKQKNVYACHIHFDDIIACAYN